MNRQRIAIIVAVVIAIAGLATIGRSIAGGQGRSADLGTITSVTLTGGSGKVKVTRAAESGEIR